MIRNFFLKKTNKEINKVKQNAITYITIISNDKSLNSKKKNPEHSALTGVPTYTITKTPIFHNLKLKQNGKKVLSLVSRNNQDGISKLNTALQLAETVHVFL